MGGGGDFVYSSCFCVRTKRHKRRAISSACSIIVHCILFAFRSCKCVGVRRPVAAVCSPSIRVLSSFLLCGSMRILHIATDNESDPHIPSLLKMYIPELCLMAQFDRIDNALEFLEKAVKEPPHLIILDTFAFNAQIFHILEIAKERNIFVYVRSANTTPDFMQTVLNLHPVTRYSPKFLFWADVFAHLPDIAQRCGLNPALYKRRLYDNEVEERQISPQSGAESRDKEPETPLCDEETENLTLAQNGKTRVIPFAELKFIQASGHYLSFHTTRSATAFRVRDTMQNYAKRLKSKGFVRPHRSYLVALRYIQEIDADFVYIADSAKRIPLSRANAANVRNAYERWKESQAKKKSAEEAPVAE